MQQVYVPFEVLAKLHADYPEAVGRMVFDGPTYMAGIAVSLAEIEKLPAGVVRVEPNPDWKYPDLVIAGAD